MADQNILIVQRAEVYSPNSVQNDLAILEAVQRHLHCGASLVSECQLSAAMQAPVVLSMGRMPSTLHLLEAWQQQGSRVINAPQGVLNATERWRMQELLQQAGVPLPPPDGTHGYWLKRADSAAQQKGDVRYCANRAELAGAEAELVLRGITRYVVSTHVEGDLVKFYGVAEGFFRYFYPTDSHRSKFGDEALNGAAHHYAFNADALHAAALQAARASQLEVWGGDAIVQADGSFCIIDFNDWPSFSACREQAARAIAALANAAAAQ